MAKNCLAALIDQDTIGYYAAMQNVLTYGITSIDADKSAEREAKNEIIPNVELLKCRLLTDGGYYSKAQNILINLVDAKLPLVDKVEKNYRLSRIFQEIKIIPKQKTLCYYY